MLVVQHFHLLFCCAQNVLYSDTGTMSGIHISVALAGSVGGIMSLIIVCQSLMIVVLLQRRRKKIGIEMKFVIIKN